MIVALYQPDIPQNAGTIIRLGACLGVPVHLIEPMGFTLTDKAFRRAGMDYLDAAAIVRHRSFAAFSDNRPEGRLILATTKAPVAHVDFAFAPDDTLLFGRESEGAPETVHRAADAAVKVPLVEGARALNVAVACAIVLGEALRQTKGFA